MRAPPAIGKGRPTGWVAFACLALSLTVPAVALDIYSSDFEQIEGFPLGELGPGGVNGWVESEGTGASAIVDTLSFTGDQSLEIAVSAAVSRAVTSTENILYVDGRYKPPLSENYPALPISSPSSAFFIFHAQDGLVGLDGDGAGGGVWAQAGVVLGATFHRLTIRLNFSAQNWDLWVDGQPTFSGFGFKDSSVSQLNGLRIDSSQSAPGHLDTVVIGTDLPDFLIPTPTLTATASPSPSFTVTRTPTPTPTSSLTPTATPSASPSPSSTESFTATPSRTLTHTLAPTVTRTPSASVTASETPTGSESPTQETTATETQAPTGTPTETGSETPTGTASPEETSTPTSTPTQTSSPTESGTPTETQSGEPTSTETHSPTPSRTPVDPNQVDHFLFQFAMQFHETVDSGNEMFEQPSGDGRIEASDLLYWLALLSVE